MSRPTDRRLLELGIASLYRSSGLLSVLAEPLYFWLSFSGVSMPGESIGVGIFRDYWSALVGLPWSI